LVNDTGSGRKECAMNFPPETNLRLCRKTTMESLMKLREARTIAAGNTEIATLTAIDRASASVADLIANLDYQLTLLERRRA
jgi:hypothetical protein